jgi:hypothetical protein
MKNVKPRPKSNIAKKPKSSSMDGYGILNRFGDFWSPRLFNSPAEAKSYFDYFWQSPGFAGKEPKWSDYKVVAARSRITAIKAGPKQNI